MKTNSFKTRLLLLTAIIFLFSLSIIITYSALTRIQEEEKNALKNSDLIAANLAHELKVDIDYAFDILRTLNSNTIVSKERLDRDIFNGMLIKILKDNPKFFGTATLWEPNAFDGKDNLFANKIGHDKTGRFIPYWTRKSNEELRLEPQVGYEEEGIGDYYLIPKRIKREHLVDPYYYKVGDVDVLMISLVSPVMINSEFMGITGIDFEVTYMQKLVTDLQSKIYNGTAQIEIISNLGKIAASTIRPDSIGLSIIELEDENADEQLKKIQRGKSESKITDDQLVITKAFSFGQTNTPWQIKIKVPYSEIIKEAKTVAIYAIIFGFVLLVIGLILIYLLVNRLTKPLYVLVEQTQKIAKGDLTGKIEIQRKDEIGMLAGSFNTMVKKLKEIIGVVIESANNFTAGTSQISTTAEQVAQGANEQASSSEEVSASIEEMAATILQTTENAKQTEIIAKDAFDGIMQVANKAKQSLDATNTVAQKITVINEIAEKTDILAINAAIEAARAGELGKGFAVVAAEVRKLAEISQKAAKEINEIALFNSQITSEAGVLMQDVIPKIQRTSQLVQEITAASIEQSSGAEQITKAIEQLSQVTQQNSAASEELSSSSEELASQAETMKDMIMFFRVERENFKKDKKKKIKIEENIENEQFKKENITLDLTEPDNKDPEFENY